MLALKQCVRVSSPVVSPSKLLRCGQVRLESRPHRLASRWPADCVLNRGRVHSERPAVLSCGLLQRGDLCTNRKAPLQKPLVILIGWLGAKERHFNKYVDLWQSMGHTTFGYRPPTTSIVLPPVGTARAADFIKHVQGFQDMHANQPVIYHIFSNAGFLFFGTVLRAIAAADALPDGQPGQGDQAAASLPHGTIQSIKGLILDSAPCRLTSDISARGFTAAALSKPAESIQLQHPRLVSVAQLLFTPILKFPPIANRQDQIWQAWSSTAPLCPQLYLFSSADALIPPHEVQQFQKVQQARGIEVHSKMWAESAHCEHYRVYPEEYVSQLKMFVDSCC